MGQDKRSFVRVANGAVCSRAVNGRFAQLIPKHGIAVWRAGRRHAAGGDVRPASVIGPVPAGNNAAESNSGVIVSAVTKPVLQLT